MTYETTDYNNDVYKISIFDDDDNSIGCLYINRDSGKVLSDSWLKSDVKYTGKAKKLINKLGEINIDISSAISQIWQMCEDGEKENK